MWFSVVNAKALWLSEHQSINQVYVKQGVCMWLEMILDLDGGLQGYLFYKNLYYSVPYVNNF